MAAHAHRAAALHGKGEHLTAHEQSRQAHQHTQSISVGHQTVAALAHKLWLERGCPDGSPSEDWFQALETLQAAAV
jgi:hypothetical protein